MEPLNEAAVAALQPHHDVLIDRIIAGVEADLRHWHNEPTRLHLNALRSIPGTVFSILEGKAEPCIYISPLDVGMGKTTTIKHTIRVLRDAYPDVGVVICLERCEQIEGLLEELELNEADYAVLMSRGRRDSKNRLFSRLGVGDLNIDQAPVLLTTQQQIELRCERGDWKDQRIFWFRGKARPLRIWDEKLAMNRALMVSQQDLHKVLGQNIPRAFRSHVEYILDLLKVSPNRQIIVIPEQSEPVNAGAIVDQLPEAAAKDLDHHIRNIVALEGLRALTVKDSEGGAFIQYRRNLPADFLPVLVLDASAPESAIYQQQRDRIRLLPGAAKRFDRMTINVMPGASGKVAFWKNKVERVKSYVEIIRNHPDKHVLVIHPMDRGHAGWIKTEFQQRLTEEEFKRVHLIHWGIHTAVNRYAHCSVVICPTLHYWRRYMYEGKGRAAADRDIDQDYTIDEVNEIEKGEVLSDIKQGIGRACIRTVRGSQALECIVYLHAPTKQAIRHALGPLFPGCKIANGEGRLTQEESLIAFLNTYAGPSIAAPEVYRMLGIHTVNFCNMVQKAAVKERIRAAGFQLVKGKTGMFERIAAEPYGYAKERWASGTPIAV